MVEIIGNFRSATKDTFLHSRVGSVCPELSSLPRMEKERSTAAVVDWQH